MTPDVLYLAWQDPRSRGWFAIGRLTHEQAGYRFVYTHGVYDAKQAGFRTDLVFPDIDRVYESLDLFPFFTNRVLSRTRPDYALLLQRLKLPMDTKDPLVLLARSGGRRQTDRFELFASPQGHPGGELSLHFFIHGIRHLPAADREAAGGLESGQRLYLHPESDNASDPHALMLRTADGKDVGYCPRYLAPDLQELLGRDSQAVHVIVEQVNPPPAPEQLRVLCEVSAPWPEDYHPFNSREYELVCAPSASELPLRRAAG